MHSAVMLSALGAALVSAQAQPPPPESLLTMTMSAVLPVAPPGFTGVETEEGAIIYDGPANASFTAVNGLAPTQTGLPAATYQAVLPVDSFDNLTGTNIEGSITGASTADGTGVTFTVNFTGFPSESEYGPFVYHIHAFPVPADGNCTATIGHLDPTDRGEYYPCDPSAPADCQVGDLAGKHGNITTPSFTAQYSDDFLSTDPSSNAFFGDLSVVIHSTNTTRLTCANFQLVSSTNGTSLNGTSPSTPSPTSSVTPFTGSAARVSTVGAAGALVFAAVAFFL